jgi:hypothetical protein
MIKVIFFIIIVLKFNIVPQIYKTKFNIGQKFVNFFYPFPLNFLLESSHFIRLYASESIVTIVAILTLNSCSSDNRSDAFSLTSTFETSKGTKTATYQEVIEWYEALGKAYTSIKVYEMGRSDSGEPLHLVTFNPNRNFESEFTGKRDKAILLINNGIHPGESDGIDASMLYMRDLASGKITEPGNLIIAVVPVYNIGGALNRNSNSRANQNGPEEYGFRGNARNFDLNRDFIKADTRNALSFAELFRTVKPDFFIDTHVSNGADYQYVLTHLFTQHNRLSGPLGDYLHNSFMPALEDSLSANDWDITPYVNVFNQTPGGGFRQFMDGPRYSTGYTSLFHTLGMMVETHMLKPYKDRVEGTYALLREFTELANANAKQVIELRQQQKKRFVPGMEYPISWKTDSSRTSLLQFKGYQASFIESAVTGKQRLKYDRSKPVTYPVTYYNYSKPERSVSIPDYYVIPKGQWPVIERLRANKVKYERLQKDSLIRATVYYIEDYQTSTSPYEGHYPHYNTVVRKVSEDVTVRAGDYKVSTDQEAVRYLVETLEPEAEDSFFNWNFFDAILRQKEGFSPYVWEDRALEFLRQNPAIRADFEAKKAADAWFNGNWYAQLEWIYKRSPNYEKAHLRYPIVRVGG